jgi:cell division protein FtsB
MPAKSNIKHGKNTKINRKNKQAYGKKYKKKKEEKKSSVFFFNLFIAAAVLICLFGAFNNFTKVAQRNERLETLEKEQNSMRIKNDALKNKLERSREKILDEDYVIEVAKAHGLRRDSDILFYLYPDE